MGHRLHGLLAYTATLEAIAQRAGLRGPVDMRQGIAYLPLNPDDLDSILPDARGYFSDFTYLSQSLLDWLKGLSVPGGIAYIETDYFGGIGDQGGVLVCDREVVLGPARSGIGPINAILRELGVKVTELATDEFEAVGLDRYRHHDSGDLSE